MSLRGSWDFAVTHGGTVYRCHVDDDRIDITAPSGASIEAIWVVDKLDHFTGYEGDTPDEQIPDEVVDEAEDQMCAMAEAAPS